MALFRRRRSEQPDGPAPAVPAEAGADDPGAQRTGGPFDQADAELADSALTRIDLGSLQVPALPGVRVQVEADRRTEQVMGVTGVVEGAAVQVQAFAAPRSEGLWAEIREEMLRDIAGTQGAQVGEADGPFGPELRGVVPGRSPEGKPTRQAVRFVGIDGPRWFVRAVFLGRAATTPNPEDALHRLVRQTIVVRGEGAMAPRDPLPLRLPPEPDAEAPGDAEAGAEGPSGGGSAGVDPFRRGPEITETR